MEPTLPELLADVRNLTFFFVGFGVIWLFVLGFAFMVTRRSRDLRAEIQALKDGTETRA